MLLNKQEKNIVRQYSFIYKKLYEFDKKLLSLRKKMIKKNLKECRISKNHNLDSIMDVGTGIQTIALSKLFPHSKIYHYDMNSKIVNIMKKNSNKNIFSKRINLSSQKVENKFNFIYLYGVVHHLRNYNFFFNNLNYILKKKGKVFFRIYRTGSLGFYIVDFIRKFIAKDKSKFKRFIRSRIDKPYPDKLYERMIDDFVVDYVHLFEIKNLLKYLKNNNFNLVYVSKHKNYDHSSKSYLQGISIAIEKISEKRKKNKMIIKTQDQLEDIDYKEPYIKKTNKMLKILLKKSNTLSNKLSFICELYRKTQTKDNKNNYSQKKNHLMIQDIILKYFKNDIKELCNLK